MTLRATTPVFRDVLEGLVERAISCDVPPPLAEKARALTERALGIGPLTPVSQRMRRRAEAYFSAVVRRATVRGVAGVRASARLVAAAVVADLSEAGRDGASIWYELERGWGGRLPSDLLEEYRLRLCG